VFETYERIARGRSRSSTCCSRLFEALQAADDGQLAVVAASHNSTCETEIL
jgi:hypothetical protein